MVIICFGKWNFGTDFYLAGSASASGIHIWKADSGCGSRRPKSCGSATLACTVSVYVTESGSKTRFIAWSGSVYLPCGYEKKQIGPLLFSNKMPVQLLKGYGINWNFWYLWLVSRAPKTNTIPVSRYGTVVTFSTLNKFADDFLYKFT
jgi:hypothetical protein